MQTAFKSTYKDFLKTHLILRQAHSTLSPILSQVSGLPHMPNTAKKSILEMIDPNFMSSE
jgi:hypothetical protein